MLVFLASFYPWIKAFHVISMIAWMAGMFYLPRLYVYHAGAKPGGELSETLKVMERRLLRIVINPAMILTWVFGLMLVSTPGIIDWSIDLWFYVKMVLVLALLAMHGFNVRWRRDFERDQNIHSATYYRFANEGPTVLMVIIVIMVEIRPFFPGFDF